MKNYKSKILLSLLGVAVLVLFVFVGRGENNEVKDFIDLDNSFVTENEGSVENVKIANREMVQVRFSYEVNGIKYNDALNFTKDQYEKMSQEDIEEMKVERFKIWVNSVNKSSKQEALE